MNFCCCTFFSYFCSLWYNTFTNCWVSSNLELEKNYTHFIEKFNKRLILFSEKVVSWCCVYLWNKIYRYVKVYNSIVCFYTFSDMGRAMIALFITAFFFMFVSFITGVVGCWRTSPSNINGSAILMLIACKFFFYNSILYNYFFFMKMSRHLIVEQKSRRRTVVLHVHN